MQVELENIGTLERKLTVTIPADTLDQQVSDRMTRMGREVRLKGFRPGRVPRSVIEKRYGDQIRNEALSDLISSSFREAVEQEKLSPVAAPAINTSGKPEEGKIAYTATFEVLPELPAVDVSSFTIEKPVAEVADGGVDEMIETLRQQRRTYEAVDRKAARDDMVLFEFEASTSEGKFPEKGRERVGTILGSGQFNADVESALEGLKVGDDFVLETTFAESLKFEDLAGKLSNVKGKVLRVQEPSLPDVDAAFFKAFGIEDGDEDSFRKEVHNNLDRELNAAMGGRLKSAVAKALAAAHADVELPRIMVVSEARSLAGLDQQATLSEEQFRQIEPAARERVIAGLLFNKIARDNQILVDDRRVGKALAAIASTYEDPEQVVEVYQNNPELMGSLRNRVLEEQVAEWVTDKAKCVDKPMSFNDLLKPPTKD